MAKSTTTTTPTELYQLKISLRDSKPLIWRRVILPCNILMPKLHQVIQIAMGWEDYHMHHFYKGNSRIFYAPAIKNDLDLGDVQNIDYKKIPLSDLLSEPKSKLMYEYDFGDSWYHVIELEKILPPTDKKRKAVCIKGVNACPFEDCGGIWGYEELKKTLANPKHEDYEEMREWIGVDEDEEFDPTFFDIEEVNYCLADIKV